MRITTHILIFLISSFFLASTAMEKKQDDVAPLIKGFRPPAVPLIVFDAFMNIWSMADNLYDDWPRLWCGPIKAMAGGIRIDGKAYRYMGPKESGIGADEIKQTDVTVEPTRTVYTFENDQIKLVLQFTTPTVPTDLDMLAQPITYITYHVSSKDGNEHQVELYFDQTAEIAVNNADEEVDWSRPESPKDGPKHIMKLGTKAQNILGKAGDCDAINWGYAYISVNPINGDDAVSTYIGGAVSTRKGFVENGKLPEQDDSRHPRRANDEWPVMAVTWSFKVSANQAQSRFLTFGYDDVQSILYFGKRMTPYWSKDGQTMLDVLTKATQDYSARVTLLEKQDKDLLDKLVKAANPEYSTISSAVFRQTFGACKLVWNTDIKGPWYFMKEISSNGDLQTVDVIFPASTLFLYTNPHLLQLLLLPLMAHANNETSIAYDLPWAPHHIGTYPVANLQPKDQENMPVEETGNMLMMIAALVKYSKRDGKDYHGLLYPHYDSLIKSWAKYLTSGKGVLPDPGDQLCTDDFLGPSPHNVNLALKGIVGLGCYAKLAGLLGRKSEQLLYAGYARTFAAYWLKNGNDGDHTRLQYDLPNTWSLKYNLLYQYILDINTFDDTVIEKEMAFHKAKNMNKYGIALNNQKTFTKLDWLAWMAAMANEEDRLDIFKRIYNFAHETPNRVPLTDWYDTVAGTKQGFQARPVLGGYYAWMVLYDLNQATSDHSAKTVESISA